MKPHYLLATIFSLILSPISVYAQDSDEELASTLNDKDKLKDLNNRFSNLKLEERKKYLHLRSEAQRFFSNKRTFETLMAIHELRTIFNGDPVAYNLEGAIYVELRDFKKAREIFTKAMEYAGEDPKLIFNLAELEFCDNRWESCIKLFSTVLKKAESQPVSDFQRICDFKIMLSYQALLKSDDPKLTEEQKKQYLDLVNQFANKYSFLADSPYYYYAQAALKFYNDEKIQASEWLITAKKVYVNSPKLLTSWDDTLVEFGYIQSHYGDHFSKSPAAK